MSFLCRNCHWSSLSSSLRLYSISARSHYDVLRLQRNCSDRDIKEAYFRLSKEYHPDMNKERGANERFVQIAEAYNILGKPSSRAQYDRLTCIPQYGQAYYRNNESYYSNSYTPPTYTEYTQQTSNSGSTGREARPLTNHAVLALCCVFAVLGLAVQMFVIRESFVRNRRIEMEKTKKNAEQLARVQATALENGNELQTKLMLERIVGSAQPPAATAALARALATGQKDEIDELMHNLGLTANYVEEDYEGFTYIYLRNLFKYIN